MKETIEALKALQQIDTDSFELIKEREERLLDVERLKEAVKKLGTDLEARKQALDETKQIIKDKEGDLVVNRESEKKAKGKLGAATKTKEYIAAQRELENLKRDNKIVEEDILKHMEEVEEWSKTIGEQENRFNELKAEITREEEASTKRLAEIDKQMEEVEKARKSLRESLTQDIYSRYERIKKAREGLGIAPVINQSCSGCMRQLPPQLFNIILRVESLESCPHCNRFLFIPEEEIPLTGNE